jgi:hypothetical protein
MKKRFMIVIASIAIAITLAYFIFSQNSPLENLINPSPEQGKNDTQSPWRFPKITFPWFPKESGSSEGSGGSGEGDGSSGGAKGGNISNPPAIKNRYTLFVNSTHDLEVSVIYKSNNTVVNETKSLPFSLEVEEGTKICLAETTGSGTIRWLIDNEVDCPFSDCGGTLYDCDILMNKSYSIVLRQYS